MTTIKMTQTANVTTPNSKRGNVTYTNGVTYNLRSNEAYALVRAGKATIV